MSKPIESMTPEEILSKFLLNKSVKIVELSESFKSFPREVRNQMLDSILGANTVIKTYYRNDEILGGISPVVVAGVIFRRQTTPGCFTSEVILSEEKVSYCFLAFYNGFLCVFSSLLSGMKSTLDQFCVSLAGSSLENSFADNNANVSELRMKNVDNLSGPYKSKALSGSELGKNYSPFGRYNYALQGFKANLDEDKYSITLSTGGISKGSGRFSIDDARSLTQSLVEHVEANKNNQSQTGGYAKVVQYKHHYKELTPKNINIANFISEYLGTDRIKIKNKKSELEIVNDDSLTEVFDKNLVCIGPPNSGNGRYKVQREKNYKLNIAPDLELKLEEKRPRLFSRMLNKYYFFDEDGVQQNLLQWLNNEKPYSLNFEGDKYAYVDGHMYEMDFFKEYGKYIKNMFVTKPQLVSSMSEKGEFAVGQTRFEPTSMTEIVLGELENDPRFTTIIIDDIGSNERGDIIAIGPAHFAIYHLKAIREDKFGLRTSKFSEVVHQATKNLIYFQKSILDDFESKRSLWEGNYPTGTSGVVIPRILNGKTFDNFREELVHIFDNPSATKEVHVVSNILSANQFEEEYQKLLDGKKYKAQLIQLISTFSSLLASCNELDVKLKFWTGT